MAIVRKYFLALGLLVVTNEILKLSVWNFVWRWAVNLGLPTHCVCSFLPNLLIRNMAERRVRVYSRQI
jgi:hypothetical protein